MSKRSKSKSKRYVGVIAFANGQQTRSNPFKRQSEAFAWVDEEYDETRQLGGLKMAFRSGYVERMEEGA